MAGPGLLIRGFSLWTGEASGSDAPADSTCAYWSSPPSDTETALAGGVGYGDTFPITGTGRMVAVALMLVGISLVGVITATVAAWFIAQTGDAAEVKDSDLAERLTKIEAALAEILTGLQATTGPSRVGRG